ncbi:kinase-like domain-containing protein [Mycena crocata]|nr:kinase-like domain-containing protein [Mycena crocata]
MRLSLTAFILAAASAAGTAAQCVMCRETIPPGPPEVSWSLVWNATIEENVTLCGPNLRILTLLHPLCYPPPSSSFMSPSASHILPDLTGEFIDDGALELLCLLGSGAYGKVYKALDTFSPLDAPVFYAVKCMPLYEPDSRGAMMLDNELMVHGMLSDHPRVITLHRHFTTDEFVFAVLDFCDGGDFFTSMVERKTYRRNPTLIKQVFGEILDAVEYIHRNSVYHRDIKPENILCNREGTDIRLADFGLATQVAVSRQFGCGSRFYMSPESLDRSCSSGCYSARHSDLWALSVIFTNLISGCHPWSSADISDPGYAAFRGNSDYLFRALRITRPAASLLARCFHENPLRRPTLPDFRTAVNAIDFFSPEDMAPVDPPSPVLNLRLLQTRLHTEELEWDVPSPSAVGECDTPRPAFPVQVPQPIQIQLSPFDVGSCSSSSSDEISFFPSFPVPPASPSLSSSSPSFPSSGSSAPTVSSATDSSPPPTPATFAADPADVRLASIPPLEVFVAAFPVPIPATSVYVAAAPPALPPRAYLGRLKNPLADPRKAVAPASVTANRPNALVGPRSAKVTPFSLNKPSPIPIPDYRTVAFNGRPTLPTRRGFLARWKETQE